MILLELSVNWTIASTIFTIAAFITTAIYTVITFNIFRQNKTANQLSAYLTLKKDLTSDAFTFCTSFCRNNKFAIDVTNSVNEVSGFKIENGEMTMNIITFMRDVLGNIEDLALFYENDILSLDLIDAGYGYSLLYIGSNENVRNLVEKLKNGGSVCNGFGTLYLKIYQSLSQIEKAKFKPNLSNS